MCLSPAQEAVGNPGLPSALFVSLLGTVSIGQDLGLLQPREVFWLVAIFDTY